MVVDLCRPSDGRLGVAVGTLVASERTLVAVAETSLVVAETSLAVEEVQGSLGKATVVGHTVGIAPMGSE